MVTPLFPPEIPTAIERLLAYAALVHHADMIEKVGISQFWRVSFNDGELRYEPIAPEDFYLAPDDGDSATHPA
jgi:hypothetical protein